MDDNKRKKGISVASEEPNKKHRVEDEQQAIKPDLKTTPAAEPAITTVPQPGLTTANDGSAMLIKLIHTKAVSIKTKEEVIFCCQRDDNLSKVFKGLAERRFYSVPVFLQGKDKKKWISFIDLFDIVKYVNHHFGAEKMSPEHDFWKLAQESEQFQQLKVNDIMAFPTKENKFHPITQDHSLYSVLEIMARDCHAHHIPILDNMKNRHLVSMLTQSQLIGFVYENLHLLGTKKDLMIKNMKGLPDASHVVTIQSSALAIDAFKLMEQRNITGLAVIDAAGHLIETLSTKDLQEMATDGSLFWKLYRPVKQFLDYIKNDPKTVRPHHCVHVHRDETFETALTKIHTNQVHRIFIVDANDSRRPIGVISMGDLLLQLLP